MLKKLTRHGNSLALIIDRAVLELLNIDVETPLDITTNGQSLIISPVRNGERHRRFEAALAAADRKYGPMFKRLAD